MCGLATPHHRFYVAFSFYITCLENRCEVVLEPHTPKGLSSRHHIAVFQCDEVIEDLVPQSTVTFHEEVDQRGDYGGAIDATRIRNADDLPISEFFSRPVVISSFTWSKDFFGHSFNPWVAYLTNKRVANRTCNYYTLLGKLHLRFVMNGNAFMSGALMASYQPLPDVTTQYRDISLAPGLQSTMQLSTMPHILLDATRSNQVEMTLPFFHVADKIRVAAISSTYPQLGDVLIKELAPLKHANHALSTADVVPVTVYAWMTDLVLEGGTHQTSPFIVPQSEIEDQAKDSNVSQALTAVSSVAGLLTDTPVIGPYARATELATGKAAHMFKMMGYSSPTLPVDYTSVTLRNETMANVNKSFSGDKLGYDVKSELGVSTMIAGLDGTDEMSLPFLTSQWGVFHTFSWETSDLEYDLLQKYNVQPIAFGPKSANDRFAITPLTGAVLPFRFWTGTLEYNFKFFASGHHRGKLLAVYDPGDTPLVPDPESNVAYVQVIDLAEVRDVTFKIPMYQDKTWLTHMYPYRAEGESEVTVLNNIYSDAKTTAMGAGNGVLSIYCLNPLTLPNYDATIDQSVTVVVSVRGGDDFRVSTPDERFMEYRPNVVPQSSLDLADGAFQQTSVSVGETSYKPQDAVYIGESITSFRSLCKRFSYSMMHGSSASAASDGLSVRLVFPMYPINRGYAPTADALDEVSDGVGGTDYYNIVPSSPLHYLSFAFCGFRGSMRWRINQAVGSTPSYTVSYRPANDYPFSLYPDDLVSLKVVNNFLPDYNTSIDRANAHTSLRKSGEKVAYGGTLVTTTQNSMVDIEVPFYSNYRFVPGYMHIMEQPRWGFVDSANSIPASGFEITHNYYAGQTMPLFELYYATGEDFNFFFFIGWPLFGWSRDDPPPP